MSRHAGGPANSHISANGRSARALCAVSSPRRRSSHPRGPRHPSNLEQGNYRMTFEAPPESLSFNKQQMDKTTHPPCTSQIQVCLTKSKEVWVMALIPPLTIDINASRSKVAARLRSDHAASASGSLLRNMRRSPISSCSGSYWALSKRPRPRDQKPLGTMCFTYVVLFSKRSGLWVWVLFHSAHWVAAYPHRLQSHPRNRSSEGKVRRSRDVNGWSVGVHDIERRFAEADGYSSKGGAVGGGCSGWG